MRTYQFLVQCVFVSFVGGGTNDSWGFYTTLYVRSVDPSAAARRIAAPLRRKMTEAGVAMRSGDSWRTQCCIDEFWELEEPAVEVPAGGLSLFRISWFAKPVTWTKFWWIRTFRPYMLIDLDS